VRALRKEFSDALSVDRVHIGFADARTGSDGHAVIHVVPNPELEGFKLPEDIEWVADVPI